MNLFKKSRVEQVIQSLFRAKMKGTAHSVAYWRFISELSAALDRGDLEEANQAALVINGELDYRDVADSLPPRLNLTVQAVLGYRLYIYRSWGEQPPTYEDEEMTTREIIYRLADYYQKGRATEGLDPELVWAGAFVPESGREAAEFISSFNI